MEVINKISDINDKLFHMLEEIIDLPESVRELELRLSIDEPPLLFVTYYPNPTNKLTVKCKKYKINQLVVEEVSSS